MMRESLTPDSPEALIALQATNLSVYQHRDVPAGDTNYQSASAASWYKIVRQGSNFTGWKSADGISWGSITTYTPTMRSAIFAGLAVGAETVNQANNTVQTTGVFDSVVVANSPDFRLISSQTTQTVGQNASTTYTLNVDPLNGFTGAVTFSLSGNPANTTYSFSPTQWSGSGTVTLTVTTTTVPVASYPLTITGTSGALIRSTGVTLNVILVPVAAPTFSPVAGTYTSTQSVTISTTPADASIR